VKEIDTNTVEKEITKYQAKHIVVTGGEPLIQQRSLISLLRSLKEKAFFVEVETNCTIIPADDLLELVDQWNVSPKLSNSNNPTKLREIADCYLLYASLTNSFFKFVVSNPNDLLEVERLIDKYNLPRRRVFLMPEAANSQQLNKQSKWLEPLAKKYGYRFTGRKHIELWGNIRAK
jgi:7-carboxy-7-deazaguanine synthase